MTLSASVGSGTREALAQAMSKRDDYQKTMEENLALWNARLAALVAKASTAAKTKYHTELEEWKAAGEVALGKLTQLRATTGDAWDVIKAEMEKVWQTIESLLDQAEAGKRSQEDTATAQAAPATSTTPAGATASTPVVPPSEAPRSA
jgi:peptidoglycan hydrolase CwlO-like protein